MPKPKPKIEPQFRKRVAARAAGPPPPPPRKPKPKPKRTWPYALALLLAWGAIVGGLFATRWISDLPDINNLQLKGQSHDVTILDVHGRLIARRGLTQGSMVAATRASVHVENGDVVRLALELQVV